MHISILLENTACGAAFRAAHGLSLLVETSRHRILFDAGPNAAFAENADALGLSLADVDICILSHGHYDHAGGLPVFLRRNTTAPIYLRECALEEYWARNEDGSLRFIGVPKELLKARERMIFTGGRTVIDEELTLFSLPEDRDLFPTVNRALLHKNGDAFPADDFAHEQNLILREGDKCVLLAGCAHSGIVNILRKAEAIAGREMDAVFAGFHLINPSTGETCPTELIDGVADELLARRTTRYFTGHCTGASPLARLREKMGSRVAAFHSGSIYDL